MRCWGVAALVAMLAAPAMAGNPEKALQDMLFRPAYIDRQELILTPCRMEINDVSAKLQSETRAVFDLAPMAFGKMRVTAHKNGPDLVIIPWEKRQEARIWKGMEKLDKARKRMQDAVIASKLPKEEERARWKAVDAELAKQARAGKFGPEVAQNHLIMTRKPKGKPAEVSLGVAYPLELGIERGRAEAFRDGLKAWAGETCK